MSELEYVEKELPAVRLAQLTGRVSDTGELGMTIGPAFDRLFDVLSRAGVPPRTPAIAWYAGDADGTTWGVGVPTGLESMPVERVEDGGSADGSNGSAGLEVAELAAVERAVTVIHRGSMATIGDSWQALAARVDTTGLTAYAPCREVYLETPMDDQDAWVTELQQPVR